uniref:Uncharacterized protein n=1 Tax=Rhizophora mucronata TaxID=61149 RepID=A0A2P2MX53_RHIMU
MFTRVLNYVTLIECLKYYFPNTQIISTLPLKVFGYMAYILIPYKDQSKLDLKVEKYVFVSDVANKK